MCEDHLMIAKSSDEKFNEVQNILNFKQNPNSRLMQFIDLENNL